MEKPFSLNDLELVAALMDLPDDAEIIWFIDKNGEAKQDLDAMVRRMLCKTATLRPTNQGLHIEKFA